MTPSLPRALQIGSQHVAETLRVLIGGEYSGTIRDAFIARGHYAMSCDFSPTTVPGPHYQGDWADVEGDGT